MYIIKVLFCTGEVSYDGFQDKWFPIKQNEASKENGLFRHVKVHSWKLQARKRAKELKKLLLNFEKNPFFVIIEKVQ